MTTVIAEMKRVNSLAAPEESSVAYHSASLIRGRIEGTRIPVLYL